MLLIADIVYRVMKGQIVHIPIMPINRDTSLWGEDAEKFKWVLLSLFVPYLNIICSPERWSNLPEAVHGIPGVWAHQLTFLGGPRACIGYRFSLVE
jgi:cytochrome P450